MPRLLLISEPRLFEELDRSFVRRPGYSLVWAKDGVVLLEQALAGGADLIIGAVDMPALTGLALCERLRAQPAAAQVPILLIGDAGARERAKLAGASELIAVPWTRSQILTAIRGFLRVPDRAADRAPVTLRVACTWNGESYIAFTRDVSSTGVFLKGVSLAGPGARLQMKMQIPSGGKEIEYDLVGEVVRQTVRDAPSGSTLRRPSATAFRDGEVLARAGADFAGGVIPGVGVRFLDLPVDSRLPLARFVRERSGR